MYSVIIDGNILEGFEPAACRAQLARLIGQSELVAARLLSGRPTVVKEVNDETDGQRYLNALRRIGVNCHLEHVCLEFDDTVWLRSASTVRVNPEVRSQVALSEGTRARSGGARAKAWKRPALVGTVSLLVLAGIGIAVSRFHPDIEGWFGSGNRTLPSMASAVVSDKPSSSSAGAKPEEAPTARSAPPASANATAPPDDKPAAGPASATGQRELGSVLRQFLLAESAPSALPPTTLGEGPSSPIRWDTFEGDGRRGALDATIGGKPATGKNGAPSRWEVNQTFDLSVEGGALKRVSLSVFAATALNIENALSIGGLALTPTKCHDTQAFAGFFKRVYEVSAPGHKPAWLSIERNCGTAGCVHEVAIIYSKVEALQESCEMASPDAPNPTPDTNAPSTSRS